MCKIIFKKYRNKIINKEYEDVEVVEDTKWYCPLYNKEIAEGLCLDINHERLKFFKTGILKELWQETKKKEPEVSQTCEACSNQPLHDFTEEKKKG